MKLPFGIEINWSRQEKGRKPKSRRVLGGFLPSWSYDRELGTDSDYRAQLNAYRHWVYVASNKNATSVASTPLRLYFAKPSKNTKSRFPTKIVDSNAKDFLLKQQHISNLPFVRKSVDIEEIVDHPILQLMSSVNNFMNGFDLWEISQLYQELTGNAYWLIINNGLGNPAEIWPIPSDRIKIVPDKENFIKGYMYEYSQYKQFIPENQIIHFKMPNPKNMYYGLSPLMAARESYNINENMLRYELSLFENMGRLEGGFFTEQPLDDDEFERLKSEIRDAFIGVGNAGKAPLFENGVEYKSFGLSPAELSYRDGRLLTKEEILNIFGLNLSLFSEKSTRANADNALVQYARSTVKPRLTRIEQKLNEKFTTRWGNNNLFLSFDNCVPEDVLQASKIRSENIRTGVTTINEERKSMRLPAIPGADEPLFQVQYAPLSAILSGQTIKPANQPSPSANNNQPSKTIDEIAEELAPIIAKKISEKVKQKNL